MGTDRLKIYPRVGTLLWTFEFSPEAFRMIQSPAVARNHWPDSACARAFWGQQELPPYRRLLADTTAWLDPRPGERWLDLGCGSGQLTRAIWEKSGGRVSEIVAL